MPSYSILSVSKENCYPQLPHGITTASISSIHPSIHPPVFQPVILVRVTCSLAKAAQGRNVLVPVHCSKGFVHSSTEIRIIFTQPSWGSSDQCEVLCDKADCNSADWKRNSKELKKLSAGYYCVWPTARTAETTTVCWLRLSLCFTAAFAHHTLGVSVQLTPQKVLESVVCNFPGNGSTCGKVSVRMRSGYTRLASHFQTRHIYLYMPL